MYKIVLFFLFNLLVFNINGSLAQRSGGALSEKAEANYFAVRYHQVKVDIQDNQVLTQVVQEIYNPGSTSINEQYMFPLASNVIISSFQATLDGEPQTVTHQNANDTKSALYEAVAKRRDPSLLQYVDLESIVFDINLPPQTSQTMTLTYKETLSPIGGLYHYHYGLSMQRYSLHPLESASVSVNLNLSGGLGSLYSASHTVHTTRLSPGQAEVTWQAENSYPDKDFALFFAPTNEQFGGGFLTGQADEQDHFLFLFAPDVSSIEMDTLPKDIVFVIDRSGSMSGQKIEQAQNALQFILGQLNPDDRFSIVAFNSDVEAFSNSLYPFNQQTLATARDFVDTLNANGGTDLESALQTGLQIFKRSQANEEVSRQLVFLTDGLPTAGITDGATIANLITPISREFGVRLHVFGVGYDVNTHLLDRLATENNGSVSYVQPDDNLELVLTDFYKGIANPLLTDVTVEFEGMTASDLYPQQIPDLFEGSSLLLSGRYQALAPTITVRVQGWMGNKKQVFTYDFVLQDTGDYPFVPHLWATRRIGDLLNQVRVSGEKETTVEEIRRLGLSCGIVTPYTSFVITAQNEGVASSSFMNLYGNQRALNQVSGETTVQARVQNQAYQQAAQGDLARGANIISNGQQNVAQVTDVYIDLSLFKLYQPPQVPITEAWIKQNIDIDREVIFASESYFALADDAAIRPFLQSGVKVIFAYNGEVIAIQEQETSSLTQSSPTRSGYSPSFSGNIARVKHSFLDLLRSLFE